MINTSRSITIRVNTGRNGWQLRHVPFVSIQIKAAALNDPMRPQIGGQAAAMFQSFREVLGKKQSTYYPDMYWQVFKHAQYFLDLRDRMLWRHHGRYPYRI